MRYRISIKNLVTSGIALIIQSVSFDVKITLFSPLSTACVYVCVCVCLTCEVSLKLAIVFFCLSVTALLFFRGAKEGHC